MSVIEKATKPCLLSVPGEDVLSRRFYLLVVSVRNWLTKTWSLQLPPSLSAGMSARPARSWTSSGAPVYILMNEMRQCSILTRSRVHITLACRVSVLVVRSSVFKYTHSKIAKFNSEVECTIVRFGGHVYFWKLSKFINSKRNTKGWTNVSKSWVYWRRCIWFRDYLFISLLSCLNLGGR